MAKMEVSTAKRAKHGTLLSIFMALLSLAWVSPILIVLMNSFKRKAYIFKYPFGISTPTQSRRLTSSKASDIHCLSQLYLYC